MEFERFLKDFDGFLMTFDGSLMELDGFLMDFGWFFDLFSEWSPRKSLNFFPLGPRARAFRAYFVTQKGARARADPRERNFKVQALALYVDGIGWIFDGI